MTAPSRLRLALLVMCAMPVLPLRANAACVVETGAEGELSTWLATVSVRVPRTRPARTIAQHLDELAATLGTAALTTGADAAATGRLRWAARSEADDHVHLEAPPHPEGARWLLTGVDLVAERGGSFDLLVGNDDGIVFYLDGREIARRANVRDLYDDDLLVPLRLSPGRHHLVALQYVEGGAMRLEARLLDGSFEPTRDVRVELPGVDDPACDELSTHALRVATERELSPDTTTVHVTLSAPGGLPHVATEETRAFRVSSDGLRSSLGGVLDFRTTPLPVLTLDATVPASTRAILVERIELGSAPAPVATISTDAAPSVRHALARVHRELDGFDESAPPSWLPLDSLTSIRYVAERLAHLVSVRDDDDEHLAAEAATLDAMLDALAMQHDPYAHTRGPMRRAYRSPIDGSLQGYSLYVPSTYRDDHPFPLIVALHGMGGTAHRMLAVIFGLYDEHESHTHADRHLPPLPADARAIVAAPYGFGDAGYRSLGEDDVLQVVSAVQRAYRIDPDRTYMTGLSMGGIGAAGVPLHNPDVFAATAALCGYHSYFVRTDTQGPHRPWEEFLMQERSNSWWAENGLHLPLYVVHGTQDRPVENSRVLVDRYTELHYRVESEWPDLGHNVWSTTYADGRIFPYFLQFHRDAAPHRVRFRTAGMRWHRAYWVEIDRLERSGVWGEVDAAISSDGVRVDARGIAALTLTPPAPDFTAHGDVVLHVESDAIPFHAGESVSIQRDPSGHWARAPRVVDVPLGPIRDVFDRPIAVVYGTHAPAERAMDERVARAWARVKPGVHAQIPVVADDSVTDDLARTHALVLVGTPAGNAYLARIAGRLPIRVEGDAVVQGNTRYVGSEVGATFVAENPDVPGQTVLVVTGVSALGIWRSRFLPDLVPDYVVYDERVAPARGRVTLGEAARVDAGGFWGPR